MFFVSGSTLCLNFVTGSGKSAPWISFSRETATNKSSKLVPSILVSDSSDHTRGQIHQSSANPGGQAPRTPSTSSFDATGRLVVADVIDVATLTSISRC